MLARRDLRSRFHALVVDYKMPGLDGMELARRLRATGFSRPIILCSAYLNPEVQREAKALDTKTVDKSDLNELVATVRQTLEG